MTWICFRWLFVTVVYKNLSFNDAGSHKNMFQSSLVKDDEFQIDGSDLFLFQVIFLLHRFDPMGFITMN